MSSSEEKKPDSSGLPVYPSSEELHSSDEEPQPFPVDPTFPERQFVFDETWTHANEREFRGLCEENIISLRYGLTGYDDAVEAEKLYWKDRVHRDRERRANPPPPPPEIKLSPHAYVPHYVDPNGTFFFISLSLSLLLSVEKKTF